MSHPVESALLDPWLDARILSERLSCPDARLVVMLGADAWCEKCRAMRPVFEAASAGASPDDVWLWLDLEDHAGLIGGFVPDDLPWLTVHRGDVLTFSGVVSHDDLGDALRSTKTVTANVDAAADIKRVLTTHDWAA